MIGVHKIYLYIISILLIINIVFGCILYNGRIDERRSVELIKQLRSEISTANRTVERLTQSGEDKQRTIDRLTANQRQSEERITELTKLSQQRQDIINSIRAGNKSDSEDLRRLREIIETLPKAK